ncbi:MAG: hypothetical protein ACR2L2_03270 [Acidobacteriota bacterium]
MIFVVLLALFAFQDGSDCLTLDRYMRSMREIPLEQVSLYKHPEHTPGGRIEELNLSARPAVIELSGAGEQRPEWSLLCVRRADLENHILYRVSVRQHNNDGLACISFDEGMPHGTVYQQAAHNRAREITLTGYWFSDKRWNPLPLQSGFSQESFLFDCGVRVGNPALLDLLERGQLEDGQALLPASSPLRAAAQFRGDVEVQLGNTRYLVGQAESLPRNQ